MFIPDPDLDFLPIPDPASRGKKGTGSRIPDPDPQHWFLSGFYYSRWLELLKTKITLGHTAVWSLDEYRDGRLRMVVHSRTDNPPPRNAAASFCVCMIKYLDLWLTWPCMSCFGRGQFLYLGKWKGVWPPKSRFFWALRNGIKPSLISRAQPPHTCPFNGFSRIKSITYEAV